LLQDPHALHAARKITVVANIESGFFSALPKAWKISTTLVVSTQQLKTTVMAEVPVLLRNIYRGLQLNRNICIKSFTIVRNQFFLV